MATKISNITDLRNDLLFVYRGLRSGTIDPTTAKEASNTAGKIISSVKTQLAYAQMRSESPEIPFME